MPAGPRPQSPSWGGPCYSSSCVQFRAQIEAQTAAAQAQWDYELESERAAAVVAEQRAAMEKQSQQEELLKSQYAVLAAEATTQAGIAKKESAAVIGKQRTQSRIVQAQAQQELQRMAPQQKQTRQAGASVGQPGVSKTRVGTRLTLGGYGGTAAGKINPTGLNI